MVVGKKRNEVIFDPDLSEFVENFVLNKCEKSAPSKGKQR